MSFFGANIKRFRQEIGWTQGGLAEKSGVSRARISDIERGVSEASVGQAVKIALAMDKPVLIATRCRDCEIRTEGFKAFFPDIDISAYAELMDVYNELKKRMDELQNKIKLIDDLRRGTASHSQHFKELRKMFKELSYVTYVAAGIADMMMFIKR